MSLLFQGDCLDHMKSIDDNSVDLIFCDLPYGQTSCKWDCKINLNDFWIQIMRIKKINTPIFFTTTTKFGVDLITSAPKKCPFRYDLVWVKSAPAGFLSAKKMPLRKHEMIYVFYEKLPLYDLSSHTHKFIKERDAKQKNGDIYGGEEGKKLVEGKYDPPLPVSVVKEPEHKWIKGTTDIYGKAPTEDSKECGGHQQRYDPPLPVSVLKEEKTQISKPHDKDLYGAMKGGTIGNVHGTNYDPPLPLSVVKEDVYDAKGRFKNGKLTKHPRHLQKGDDPIYDPPLPNTLLEIKSTRGKHSTEKPIELMKMILKYYSKEGDVVLDPTMGSGSTGVSCKEMNRNFIGIEKDPEIYEVAVNRIEG